VQKLEAERAKGLTQNVGEHGDALRHSARHNGGCGDCKDILEEPRVVGGRWQVVHGKLG